MPFVDDDGHSGVALACGECSDEDAKLLWGDDNWYYERCIGQVFYVSPPPTPMPIMPEIYTLAGKFEGPPHPSDAWPPMTQPHDVTDKASGKFLLPVRPWVYPAPGYLKLIYAAHETAGLADSLLVSRSFIQH